MKKIGILLVGLCLWSESYALSTYMYAFTAVDLLTYTKYEDDQGRNETAKQTGELEAFGIGTISATIKSKHKNFQSRIKLDLDSSLNGSKWDQYEFSSFVEVATVSYKADQAVNFPLRITGGRGRVPMLQKHWGASVDTYLDGTSGIASAHNSLRDIDKRPLLSFKVGGYRTLVENDFSFFANTHQLVKNDEGDYSSKVNYRFNFQDELGIANKITYRPVPGMKMSLGLMYYDHDLSPYATYGVSAAFTYKRGAWEYWGEYAWGKSSAFKEVRYASYKQYDDIIEFGCEWKFMEDLSVLADIGAVFVDTVGYYNGEPSSRHEKNLNAKIDTALKYSFNDSTNFTLGFLMEKLYAKRYENAEEIDPDSTHGDFAYQISSGFTLFI